MHIRLMILMTLLALVQGCATPGTHTQAVHAGVPSNDGTYLVEWNTDPTPIPVNDFFVIDARVYDAATGDPATDVELQIDAAMPQHRHGMNHSPDNEHVGPGHWRARDMLFHMPGDWVIYFDISHDDVMRRAQVSVEVD